MYDDMRAPARPGDELTLDEGPLLTRRNTLHGLAWAAPAIVIARSVPAAQSSGAAPTAPTYPAGAIVDYGGSVQNNDGYWVDGQQLSVREFSRWLAFKDSTNTNQPYAGLVSLTMEITVKHIVLDASGAPLYGFNWKSGDNATWELKAFDAKLSKFTFACKLDLSGAALTGEKSIPIDDFWTQVNTKSKNTSFEITMYGASTNGTDTVTWTHTA